MALYLLQVNKNNECNKVNNNNQLLNDGEICHVNKNAEIVQNPELDTKVCASHNKIVHRKYIIYQNNCINYFK